MAIKIVPRYGSSFRDKLYIPAIAGGMKTTFKHFFKNLRDVEGVSTLQYPEVQPSDITERYRGVHRLTKHDDGTEKCVACFMCATACPAECIFIEAEERFDGVDEKSKNHQGLFFWPNNRAITGDGQVRGTYYCKGTSGGGETVSATVSEQDTAGGTSDIHIDWDGAKSGTGGSGEGGISSGPARTRFTNCDSKELPHAFGCKSDYVREVQQCLGLPQKYQTGNFGPITQKALTDAGYNGSEIDKTTHEKITSNCNGTTSTTGSTVTDTRINRLDATPITLAPRDITSLKVPTSLNIPDLIKNLKPISINTQPSDERQAEIIRGVTDRGFDMVYKGGALTDDEKMWMLKHYGAEEGINKTKVKGDGQEKLRFN